MTPAAKFLIALAATLLMGWAWHGPLGHGEALIDGLEAQAKRQVALTEVPGIEVRLERDPLARTATLSGPANDLQREGLGSQLGISDYVRNIKGMGNVRWTDEPAARTMPLLLETLNLLVLAFLAGLAVGRAIWGRRPKQSYLD